MGVSGCNAGSVPKCFLQRQMYIGLTLESHHLYELSHICNKLMLHMLRTRPQSNRNKESDNCIVYMCNALKIRLT